MNAGLHKQAEELVRNSLGEQAAALFASLLNQEPERADAIVLLQGSRLDNTAKAGELFRRGFAPRVLLSGNNEARSDDDDATLPELQDALAAESVQANALKVDDQALNMQGQASRSMATAVRERWRKLLVVTSPYHVLRAYLAFRQQAKEQGWHGQVIMQVPKPTWDAVPGGRSRTALEMLELEMAKIRRDGLESFIPPGKE